MSTPIGSTNSQPSSQKVSGTESISAQDLNNYSPVDLVSVVLTAAMNVMSDMTQVLSNVAEGLNESMKWLQDVQNQLIAL
ncbi:MAG TPA: hypothetical protein PLV25_07830, partial [Opitutales bacterium]|nr:hypothetical protein [Opitutales bacterium]